MHRLNFPNDYSNRPLSISHDNLKAISNPRLTHWKYLCIIIKCLYWLYRSSWMLIVFIFEGPNVHLIDSQIANTKRKNTWRHKFFSYQYAGLFLSLKDLVTINKITFQHDWHCTSIVQHMC